MPDSTGQTQGRLAAVVFLDIVGYSALMASDERAALKAVAAFEEIVRAQVAAAGGRVVKFLGDGSLAEFSSSRAAVGCSMAIQAAVAARAGSEDNGGRFQVRAGVHAGDLVERGTDVFGDAVNIAARVHPLADPGGIAISGPVYDQVRMTMPLRGTRLRGCRLKNIPKRQEVFMVPPLGASYVPWWLAKHRGLIGIAAVAGAAAAAAFLGVTHFQRRDVMISLDGSKVRAYAGGGATVYVDAVSANAVTFRFRGSAQPELGPYCGITLAYAGEVAGGDWRPYSGVRCAMQTSEIEPSRISVIVVESGGKGATQEGENWSSDVMVNSNLVSAILPFSTFRRMDFQPTGQDGNGTLNLDRILKLVLQPAASSTVLVSMTVRDANLMRARRTKPPGFAGPIRGEAAVEVGTAGAYEFPVVDPDRDRVRVTVDWGDGETSETGFERRPEPTKLVRQWLRTGKFAVRAQAVDEQGTNSGWSDPYIVEVREAGGVFIDDFENIDDWFSFAVSGAEVKQATRVGRTGSGLSLNVVRGGIWGVLWRYDAAVFGDARRFSGLRFVVRGTPGMAVAVNVFEYGRKGSDSDGEIWLHEIALTDEWKEYNVPFSEFKPAEWAPDDAVRNGRLDLDRLQSIRFGNTEVKQKGEFVVDDLWFTLSATGVPRRP